MISVRTERRRMDADKIFAAVKENADAIDRLAKKVEEGRKDIVVSKKT